MDDSYILDQFFARDENALENLQLKYGRYCSAIVSAVLPDKRDEEECVNDSLLVMWNSIPPAKPDNLKSYFGSVARHIALDRYDFNKAKKRDPSFDMILDEISDCATGCEISFDDEMLFREVLNNFLKDLSDDHRKIFMQRYYHLCSVKEIAKNFGTNEINVKVILHRTRKKLRSNLEKEGISV